MNKRSPVSRPGRVPLCAANGVERELLSRCQHAPACVLGPQSKQWGRGVWGGGPSPAGLTHSVCGEAAFLVVASLRRG